MQDWQLNSAPLNLVTAFFDDSRGQCQCQGRRQALAAPGESVVGWSAVESKGGVETEEGLCLLSGALAGFGWSERGYRLLVSSYEKLKGRE